MATTLPRFAPTTTTGLRQLLLVRRASIAWSAESPRREMVDALSQRDPSDMLDGDDPSADSDGAATLMLIERAEPRHWEVEQALARLDSGTHGYCASCGASIPLERLWALPATTSCVAWSDRSSYRTHSQIDTDSEVARHRRWRSPSIRGGLGSELAR